MAEFHRFDELPRELRDQIWDLTIRDEAPGVHFFTAHDLLSGLSHFTLPDKVDGSKQVKHRDKQGISDENSFVPCTLSAPRHRNGGPQKWNSYNLSAYLQDSGLWTACWESRLRMLRRYRPEQTSSQHLRTAEEIREFFTSTFDTNVTLRILGDHAQETQYITINPIVDLLCLQSPTMSAGAPFKEEDFGRMLRTQVGVYCFQICPKQKNTPRDRYHLGS